MNTNKQGDFQVCINVPLSKPSTKTSRFKYVFPFFTTSIKGLKNTEGLLHLLLLCKHWKKFVKIAVLKIFPSSQKNIFNTVHFQHGWKLASQLHEITPSEDCLLVRKNTNLEIAKAVELKNVVRLVMKNIMKLSVEKHVPSLENYIQINFPSAVPMLFKSIGITLQQFV